MARITEAVAASPPSGNDINIGDEPSPQTGISSPLDGILRRGIASCEKASDGKAEARAALAPAERNCLRSMDVIKEDQCLIRYLTRLTKQRLLHILLQPAANVLRYTPTI